MNGTHPDTVCEGSANWEPVNSVRKPLFFALHHKVYKKTIPKSNWLQFSHEWIIIEIFSNQFIFLGYHRPPAIQSIYSSKEPEVIAMKARIPVKILQ